MSCAEDFFDIVIIGAGPAGMITAYFAAGNGIKVCLIEKNPEPGKKLLMAGSGQCNLTQRGDIRDFPFHYGKAFRFVSPCLFNWTNHQVQDFFSSLGVPTEDRGDGKIFPVSRNSRDIQTALLNACRHMGVKIIYKNPVHSVKKNQDRYGVILQSGKVLYSKRVTIATGGMSYPLTGSSGDGYAWAEEMGHTIVKPYPVLSPVILQGNPLGSCAGFSFTTGIQIFRKDKKIGEISGDLLLTHKGLSGPVILNNSRDLLTGDLLKIRLADFPDKESLERDIIARAAGKGALRVKKVLSELGLPGKLGDLILSHCQIDADLNLSHLSKAGRKNLIQALWEFSVRVQSVGGFQVAMATGGGISLKEVNPKTMESRISPGLYFAGEVLDVDGDTGGYNLQFAFSSGRMAAESMVRSLGKE